MSTNYDPEMDVPHSLESLAQRLAVEEVQSFFTEPSHLDSITKFKEEYERKRVTVENQLETGVQAQLDEMQNAVVLLRLAKAEMKLVKNNFQTIHQTCFDCMQAIGDFERIVKMKNARINLTNILRQLEIYEAVPQRVLTLNEDLDSSEENLKPVFLEWLQLNGWKERILNDTKDSIAQAHRREESRNELLAQWEEEASLEYSESTAAQSKILVVLGDHFNKVNLLGQRIWSVVEDRLSRFYGQLEGTSNLVVALEISERIDKHDDKERLAMLERGQSLEVAEMLLPPNIKRQRALTVIEQAIDKRLDALLPPTLYEEIVDDETDELVRHSRVGLFLKSANNLMADLEAISEDVSKCFPASYDIYGLYRWVVERRLLKVLRPIWLDSTQTASIDKLLVIGWLDRYLQTVERISKTSTYSGGGVSSIKRLNRSASSNVNDHKTAANERLKEFSHSSMEMMIEYIGESVPRMNKYVETILSRCDAPEFAMDGSLCTAVPEDLFHVVIQEINVVASHGITGKYISLYIRKAVLEVIKCYQDRHASTLSDNTNVEELSIEWICAFINDFERMYDLCDSTLLQESQASFQDEDIRAEVAESIDRVAIGFIKCGEVGTTKIVDCIFHELEKNQVVENLFTEAWELDTSLSAATFKATFEDYFDDPDSGIRIWLQRNMFFGKTVGASLERLIDVYVCRFFKRTRPFSNAVLVIQRLRNDRKLFVDCFQNYCEDLRFAKIRTESDLIAKFQIINLLADILSSESPQRFFGELATQFGPYTLTALSRLLYYRGDLSPDEREDFKMYVLSSDFVSVKASGSFDLSGLAPTEEEEEPSRWKKKKKSYKKSFKKSSTKSSAKQHVQIVETEVTQMTFSSFVTNNS